jgi:hypothetical protein
MLCFYTQERHPATNGGHIDLQYRGRMPLLRLISMDSAMNNKKFSTPKGFDE